jgi:asparagine synthase (glutamine-hydrolysing)
VARQYGVRHSIQELTLAEFRSELPRIFAAMDQPSVDGLNSYFISKAAHALGLKVAMSGTGGDELFGGYTSFFTVDDRRKFDRIPRLVRQGLSMVADALPYAARGKNYLRMLSRPNALERYFEEIACSSHFLRQRILNPDWRLPMDAAFLRRTFGAAILDDDRDCLSQAMHFEATAKLAGDILVKVDRMSMAHSLEVRSPLLDHRLAEVAMRVPNRWKTREGKGKLILLEALGARLDPRLLNRPKQGFGVPLPIWFRGPLREMLRDHLASARFLERGIVSPENLRLMLDEHERGRRDNAAFLWLLLVFERWLEEHEGS